MTTPQERDELAKELLLHDLVSDAYQRGYCDGREDGPNVFDGAAMGEGCAQFQADTNSRQEAILTGLRTTPSNASGVVVEEAACAQCKGLIGDLPPGRDSEEFCDTCYADAAAALSTPDPITPDAVQAIDPGKGDTFGRVEVGPDHPLYKACQVSPETIEAIKRDQLANARGAAELRNVVLGSTAPDAVARAVDEPAASLEALGREFSRWLEMGPDKQPHYPNGMRPFSTGDLKFLAEILKDAAIRSRTPSDPIHAEGEGE